MSSKLMYIPLTSTKGRPLGDVLDGKQWAEYVTRQRVREVEKAECNTRHTQMIIDRVTSLKKDEIVCRSVRFGRKYDIAMPVVLDCEDYEVLEPYIYKDMWMDGKYLHCVVDQCSWIVAKGIILGYLHTILLQCKDFERNAQTYEPPVWTGFYKEPDAAEE